MDTTVSYNEKPVTSIQIASVRSELVYNLIDFTNTLEYLGLTEGLGKWGLLSGDARLRMPLIAKLASEWVYERKNQIKRKN